MDVSSPISAVVPTLDGPVLLALARTSEPLALTEIHRRTDQGSLSGVRNVLHRLVRVGLVIESSGRFVLNREHLAAPAVELLSSMNAELLSRLRAAVNEWDGQVELFGVFGSAARRDGDEESDIDLLLISDDPQAEDFAFDLALKVEGWTGNQVQMIVRSSEELRELEEAREPIVESWRHELIVIVGDRQRLESR
jgi:predicted nucleotidyltransferase